MKTILLTSKSHVDETLIITATNKWGSQITKLFSIVDQYVNQYGDNFKVKSFYLSKCNKIPETFDFQTNIPYELFEKKSELSYIKKLL